jgi:LysR family cyn operon transcriptional activator
MHPDVHIRARSGSSEDIEIGIVSGVIDIGISVLPVDHDEIKTAELFSDDLLLIVSKSHPLADKKELELHDLHMLPVALPSHRIAWIRQLDTFLNQQGIRPKIVVEHDDGNALMEIVKKGNLATFLPQGAVMDYPHIRYWPLPDPGLRTTTAALWTHLSPAAKVFLDIATNGAKELRSERSKENLPRK